MSAAGTRMVPAYLLQQANTTLAEEREARRTMDAYRVHEHECLRTALVRSLRPAIDMLQLSLHALDHGSQDVTHEYVERVAAQLSKALQLAEEPIQTYTNTNKAES